MQGVRFAIVLSFLAGCGYVLLAGRGDLETDHLPAGATAVLVEPRRSIGIKDEPVVIFWNEPTDSAAMTCLDHGTRATVVGDEDPDNTSGYRGVAARIEEGPFQGKTGRVPRHSIILENRRLASSPKIAHF